MFLLARRDNFTQLVAVLTDQLNATVEALMEASRILELIASRNFSGEAADLQQYQLITQSVLALATRLWDSTTNISNQVQGDLYSGILILM